MADSSVKQATIRRREVAELFDKIKSKPGFFAPKEKMQHQWDKWKIPEPVFDWTPESIQGIDFVNACILAFRPYFADADRIQSFFTYAGILEEYGIVKEIVLTCLKYSDFVRTDEFQRISQMKGRKPEQQPWFVWTYTSLQLTNPALPNSGYGFRYFCGWLIGTISRTVKKAVYDQTWIRLDEVHVVVKRAEKLFFEILERAGDQVPETNLVFSDFPFRFSHLVEEREQRKSHSSGHIEALDFKEKPEEVKEDADEEEEEEQKFFQSNETTRIDRMKSIILLPISVADKQKRMLPILEEFDAEYSRQTKRLRGLQTELAELMSIYEPAKERVQREDLFLDGVTKTSMSLEKIGIKNPSVREIVCAKTVAKQKLDEMGFKEKPGMIPVLKLKGSVLPKISANSIIPNAAVVSTNQESSGELRNPDPETDIGEVLKMIDRILPPVHDPETEQKLQQVDQQVRELEADVTNSYNKLVAEGESRLKDRINNYQNLD